MNVKYYIKNVDGLTLPARANETDAGYDVIATSSPKIVGDKVGENFYRRIDYVEFETNLYITPESQQYPHVNMDMNFHTDLRPRSSVSKYNLVLANSVGLIDRGYQHQVLCRFKYIWQPEDYRRLEAYDDCYVLGKPNMEKIYKKGDKVAQILPTVTLGIDFVPVDELPGIDRGGGFGSTGR